MNKKEQKEIKKVKELLASGEVKSGSRKENKKAIGTE